MSGRRVLVIDDDRAIREIVELALSEAGHEVIEAADAETGLAISERDRPDVILLDMRMPMMDGAEFSRRYRERVAQAAPIVVLTAGENAAAAMRETGAARYLTKPFELEALLEAVTEPSP